MPSCNTSPGITSNPSGTSGGLKERRSWLRSNEPGRQPLAKIKLSLLFKRRMTSDRITVTVRDGWVTLEGSVDWRYQKTVAESAVKKLRGVTSIMNEIVVKPTVPTHEAKARIEEALRRSGELAA